MFRYNRQSYHLPSSLCWTQWQTGRGGGDQGTGNTRPHNLLSTIAQIIQPQVYLIPTTLPYALKNLKITQNNNLRLSFGDSGKVKFLFVLAVIERKQKLIIVKYF